MTSPFGLDRTFSVLSPRNISRRAARVATHFVCFAVLAVACWTATPLVAQTAHAVSVIPVGSGFSFPAGVAVDRSGDVFVADFDNNEVKEIMAGTGGAASGTVSSLSTVKEVGSGFSQPCGVAVDSSGNVFVATCSNNKVMEIVAVGGVVSSSSTVNVVGSGFDDPQGMAVDGSGNVFVADYGNNAVKEIVAVGGVVSSSSTVNTISSVFINPNGVAVDGSGNIYVSDSGNNAAKEILAAGGYTTVETLNNSFNNPDGIAVDGSGNVFVADTNNSEVKEIVAGTGGAASGTVSSSSTVNVVGGGFNYPSGVAVDGSGNVFVADTVNSEVKEIPTGGVNFGSAAVATATPPSATVIFTFDTGGSLDSTTPYQVLTQGAANLDFNAASTQESNACNGTTSYNPGDTCTVDVTFTPKYPGQRMGAVQLTMTGGAVIATAHIYGTGTGPLVTFPSNTTVNTINSSFTDPTGVAMDGSGDVFVADYLGGTVKEFVAVNGVVSASSTVNIVGSAFYNPFAVAVDGAGNVFVADAGSNAVSEIAAVNGVVSSSSPVSTISNAFASLNGVAVDGAGNVFVADYVGHTVSEIVAVNGVVSSSSTVNPIGSGFSHPAGVAVDGSGNVFVADDGSNTVSEIVAVNGVVSSSSTVNMISSGFNTPAGIAVDGAGNVFVADFNHNQVKEIVAVGGVVSSSSVVNTIGSGFGGTAGVAVDGAGNIFVADSGRTALKEIDLGEPPSVNFTTATNVGSTDTTDGPQTVMVANSGNAALNFTVPASGNNPSISADFTLDSTSSGTCPLTTGTPNTLAAGASCTLPISFAPTVGGTISGSLVLSDTNLNASPSTTQTISLNGTGQLITPTLAFATIPAHTYGDTSFIVTATSASSGAVTYTVTSGPATISGSTVTITGIGTVNLSASQAATTDYATATATTSFTVGQATPTLAFATIPAHIYGDAPFIVSATSLSSGAVTYTVTSGPATISGNTVTLTGTGTVGLSASQAATTVYAASTATTSFVVDQATPSDFSLTTKGATDQNIAAGGVATFSFALAPVGGAYPGVVSFAETGVPRGVTATFSPASIAANGGAQIVTLTLQTSAQTKLDMPVSHRGGLIVFALLFLPLVGTRRMRRIGQKLGRRTGLALLLLLSLGAVAGLSGCSPDNDYITVTATSGFVQHATNITLNVEYH